MKLLLEVSQPTVQQLRKKVLITNHQDEGLSLCIFASELWFNPKSFPSLQGSIRPCSAPADVGSRRSQLHCEYTSSSVKICTLILELGRAHCASETCETSWRMIRRAVSGSCQHNQQQKDRTGPARNPGTPGQVPGDRAKERNRQTQT